MDFFFALGFILPCGIIVKCFIVFGLFSNKILNIKHKALLFSHPRHCFADMYSLDKIMGLTMIFSLEFYNKDC